MMATAQTQASPDRQRIQAYAARYRLVVPERQQASLIGELAGRRTGSSVEFQDRKDYIPGDDLRHVDWRAFARTDRLTVKLYREEICPTVDIVVDTSASMAVTPEKRRRAEDLALLFHLLARKLHAAVSLHALGERLEPLANPLDLAAAAPGRREDPLPLLRAAPLTRKGGIKILVSDLLFPMSPDELVGTFAAADRLVLVQVLTEFETGPDPAGTLRLEDAETGAALDVALDRATVQGYRRRLERLRSDLERRVKLAGGAWAWVRDTDSLAETVRRLAQARIVAP